MKASIRTVGVTHDQRRTRRYLLEKSRRRPSLFRDILKFPAVDAGHGWLIFAMPPLEAAFHDSEKNDEHELYLTCDDIASTLTELQSRNVQVSEVNQQTWGKLASFALPGGGKIGIYEPTHPRPLHGKRNQ